MRIFAFVIFFISIALTSGAFAATEKFVGVISVITDDKSAITIDSDGKKITLMTDPEFVDMAYFEVGDKVEIEGTRNGESVKAESFRYIFDDVADENNKDEPDQPAAFTHAMTSATAVPNVAAAAEPIKSDAAKSSQVAADASPSKTVD